VVLFPFSDRFDVYGEGPWFIGYLLYRYGPESVLSLYGSLDHETASLDQISATFEALYGESLDTAWNAALASSHRVRCVNLWRCAGATLALDGSPQTLAQTCDATDLTRTFQLDAETDVVMASGFPPIRAPVTCDQELPFAVSGNQLGAVIDPAVAPMTSGKYFVQGSTEEAATVGVRVLPKKAYAQDCTQSEPVDLSAGEFSAEYFDLTIPNGEGAWFIKLRSPNNRSIWQGQPQASADVEKCIGCGESLACQPLNGETHPNADGIVTLRLTSETPGPGYVTYGLLLQ